MNQIERKRVKRFAQFLNDIPAKQFDIQRVCEITNQNSENPRQGLTGGCGTVACAIGHLPVYNPRRFKFHNVVDQWSFEVEDIETGETDYTTIGSEYFGFTADEAEWLFSPWGYEDYVRVTPKTVARRMLKLINKDKTALQEFKKFNGDE